MPSNKYRYKRRYNRKRSVLSTRNIYANRSAKTQAYQIAALKRRINYVSRQCKPEVKVLTSDVIVDLFENTLTYGRYTIIPPIQGTGDDQRIGNSVNVKNCSFRVLLKSGTGFSYRVIIVQSVAPIASTAEAPSISDLLSVTTDGSINNRIDTNNCLVSPFKDGITAKYRILRDVKGSTASDQKLLNIRYYPYRHEELDPSGNQRTIYIYLLVPTSSSTAVTAVHRYVFTDA